MGVWAIDVSRWQGRIDWHAVKRSGIRGAWVKVGGADGGMYRDSRAGENLTGAEAAGVTFGTYYFCSTDGDPARQAQHAVGCGHGRGQLWPAADLETNPGRLDQAGLDRWLSAFCGEVMRLTARESIWYGGAGTGVGYTDFAPRGCGLWIANYGRNTPGTEPPSTFRPRIPPAWERWDIWQFNSTTRVPGITENTCDQNVVTDQFWAQMTGDQHVPPAHAQLSMEDLDMKGVRCPDHTGDTVWDVTMDGFGHRRRRGIAEPVELEMLLAIEALTDVVSLHGEQAQRFLDICPEANAQLADFGALSLGMNILAYVRDRADQLHGSLSELLGRPAGDVDERSLAEFLAERMPGVPAIPAEMIEQLVGGALGRAGGSLTNKSGQ